MKHDDANGLMIFRHGHDLLPVVAAMLGGRDLRVLDFGGAAGLDYVGLNAGAGAVAHYCVVELPEICKVACDARPGGDDRRLVFRDDLPPASERFEIVSAYGGRRTEKNSASQNLLVQFDLTKATSHTPHVSGRALAFWRVIGLAGFYLTAYLCHPQRLIRLFNSIIRAGKFEPNNLIEQRVFDLIVRLKLARHNRLSVAEGPR